MEARVMPMRSEITTRSSSGTPSPQSSRSAVPWSELALVSAISIVGLLAVLVLAVATHHLDPTDIAAVPLVAP
jgi:hypothetical protein